MSSDLDAPEALRAVVGLLQLLHDNGPPDAVPTWRAAAGRLHAGPATTTLLDEAARLATAIRQRVDLLEQRERGLIAVNESAQSLTSHLDPDQLLAAIVARARELLGADVAWLSTHDPETGAFQVRVADGALSGRISAMATPRARGVASVVMSSRLPFATADYLNDPRFEHDAGLDEAFRDEGIVSLVGVPLVGEGEVVGLLFLADRYPRHHAAQNVAILRTLAAHAAVALKNARYVQSVNAALARADQARDALERHIRGVQAAAEAHEQMTSLLARGASLSALCDSIAQWFHGSVLVLDEAGQIVSRSTAADATAASTVAYDPHGERAADVSRALRESRQLGRSVVAFEADGTTCRAMAVIGGSDVLGATLLLHDGAIDDLAVRTFERGSGVVGIVLLSQERAEAARHRSASVLMRALVALRQDDPALLADQAERCGLLLAQPLALMLVQLDESEAAYAARSLRQLLPGTGVLIDDIDGLLVVLCGATRAPELRQAVVGWAKRDVRVTYRGVVSRPIAGPAELPALHATLRRALGVLARMGVRDRIVGQNELALYSTLFETHDRSSLADYLDSVIGPLLAHDRKRHTDLAATLLTYFDANQNATNTAQKLGIHVNTVRQRLATIEDLIGHWGESTRALEIHIALRLWRLGVAAG